MRRRLIFNSGIKTKRYHRGGAWVARDEEKDPALDQQGKYRPRKPDKWDESYKESGPPSWANFKYD